MLCGLSSSVSLKYCTQIITSDWFFVLFRFMEPLQSHLLYFRIKACQLLFRIGFVPITPKLLLFAWFTSWVTVLFPHVELPFLYISILLLFHLRHLLHFLKKFHVVKIFFQISQYNRLQIRTIQIDRIKCYTSPRETCLWYKLLWLLPFAWFTSWVTVLFLSLNFDCMYIFIYYYFICSIYCLFWRRSILSRFFL